MHAICPLHTVERKQGNSVWRKTRTSAFTGKAHSVGLNTHFDSSQPTMRWCRCYPGPSSRLLGARLNNIVNHPIWLNGMLIESLIDRFNRRWHIILDFRITQDKAAYWLEADKGSGLAETFSAPRVFSYNDWENTEWKPLVRSQRIVEPGVPQPVALSTRLVNADK